MADSLIVRDAAKFAGRLVVLPSKQDILSQYDPADPTARNVLGTATFIEFPSLPDTIALRRAARYFAHTNQFLPDGIHQYLGTDPLVIEMEFRLHSADEEYCKYGPLTLIEIAARLHALVLPINPTNQQIQVGAKVGVEYKNDSTSIEKSANGSIELTNVVGASLIRDPVVCQLELMNTGNGQPGIICRGYVREVSVKFNGPYLRGNNNMFNLPTSADYSFTFVHRPGHTNVYSWQLPKGIDANLTQPQAFANDVKDKFYNTRDLVKLAIYQGFDKLPSSTGTQASAAPVQSTSPPLLSFANTPNTLLSPLPSLGTPGSAPPYGPDEKIVVHTPTD